jgi:hypothetical protein
VAITAALICSNCASRSGWLLPPNVLRFTCRRYCSPPSSLEQEAVAGAGSKPAVLGGVRGSRAQALSVSLPHRTGRPAIDRCRDPPSSPIQAAYAVSSRSSLQSRKSPPSETDARLHDPAPFAPHGREPQEKACLSSDSSWLHFLRSWSLRQTRGGSLHRFWVLAPRILFNLTVPFSTCVYEHHSSQAQERGARRSATFGRARVRLSLWASARLSLK